MFKGEIPFKSRNGAALIYVLFVLIILSAIATVVMGLNMNNLHQAKYQEYNIQAHYLAYSGVELGYAALMELDDINDEYSSMLYTDFCRRTVSENGEIVYKPKRLKKEETDYPLGEGTANITIESFEDSGKWWIEITSTGKLKNKVPNAKTDYITNTVALKFPFDNPLNKTWTKE